ARAEQSWPKCSWPLLEVLGKMADALSGYGSFLLHPGQSWPANILLDRMNALADAADLIRHPPEEPKPFERTLESIREVREQKLTDRQICAVFDWKANNEADIPRLRAVVAEHGADYASTVTVMPKSDPRIPPHRPRSGVVIDFCEMLARIVARDEPAPASESDLAGNAA